VAYIEGFRYDPRFGRVSVVVLISQLRKQIRLGLARCRIVSVTDYRPITCSRRQRGCGVLEALSGKVITAARDPLCYHHADPHRQSSGVFRSR